LVCCISFSSCSLLPEKYVEYRELGIPMAEAYPTNSKARCVWDMAIYEDQLFIGGGDYDTNAGPVDIQCFDLSEEAWEKSGTVPDEEVSRFCFINGCLTVPGTDPTGSWELGNYYRWNDGAWETLRVLPGGIHNFDLVEFDGLLFAGLGVMEGEMPIACSKDGGKTFSSVEMQKNGFPLETTGKQNRVYDLFGLNGTLYAAFYGFDTAVTYDLYRFDGEKFVFDNTWYGKIHQIQYSNNIIGGKAEYRGKMFFTTGYLYITEDMDEVWRIDFPHSETVYDLYAANGSLYVLCGEAIGNGQYKISVWENKSGEKDDFRKLFAFPYDAPPLSMVRHGGKFYIGIGDSSSENEKNGMVLCVEYAQ